MTDEMRNYYENIIFDSVAQKSWNTITAVGVDSIRELSSELESSTDSFGGAGQSAGMAAKQLDNLKGDIALAKSEMRELSQTVGELFLPNARETAQTVTAVIRGVSDWAGENPELVKTIAAVASSMGIATVALKGGRFAVAAVTWSGPTTQPSKLWRTWLSGATKLQAVTLDVLRNTLSKAQHAPPI